MGGAARSKFEAPLSADKKKGGERGEKTPKLRVPPPTPAAVVASEIARHARDRRWRDPGFVPSQSPPTAAPGIQFLFGGIGLGRLLLDLPLQTY